jgi:hypothetical protein
MMRNNDNHHFSSSSSSQSNSPTSLNRKRRRRTNNGYLLRLVLLCLLALASVRYLYTSVSLLNNHDHQNDENYSQHPALLQLQSIPKIISRLCGDPSISYLQVVPPPPSSPQNNKPKILCIVLTQSSNHATRLQTIQETWGPKCTDLIAASDADDPNVKAHKIDAMQGYWGIWDKLMQTLGIVMNNRTLLLDHPHHPDDYDWILKADDDTYIIMENLQDFLLHQPFPSTDPLIFGRTMPWPQIDKLANEFPGWFRSKPNKAFGERFLKRFPLNHTLVYAHGGPGYIMNWKYAQLLTKAYFQSKNVVKGKISEDMANAVTMLYRNITPKSTIDTTNGKERSHPESPQTMYDSPNWLPWVQSNIQNLGKGPNCCSPTSFGFHHVTEHTMRIMDYQLYTCPKLGMATRRRNGD